MILGFSEFYYQDHHESDAHARAVCAAREDTMVSLFAATQYEHEGEGVACYLVQPNATVGTTEGDEGIVEVDAPKGWSRGLEARSSFRLIVEDDAFPLTEQERALLTDMAEQDEAFAIKQYLDALFYVVVDEPFSDE